MAHGRAVKVSDFDALTEIATICSLCNDSSVDYNEVRQLRFVLTIRHYLNFILISIDQTSLREGR